MNSEKLKKIFSNRLFQNVPVEVVRLNLKSKNFFEVEEDQIIYKVNDNDDSIYLILEGQIKIKVYDSSSRPSIINKLEGDFFGEIEFLENTHRKSTAMSAKKSLLYILDQKAIDELSQNQIINYNLTASNYSKSAKPSDHSDVHNKTNSFLDDFNSTMPYPEFDEQKKYDDLAWNNLDHGDFKEIFNQQSKDFFNKDFSSFNELVIDKPDFQADGKEEYLTEDSESHEVEQSLVNVPPIESENYSYAPTDDASAHSPEVERPLNSLQIDNTETQHDYSSEYSNGITNSDKSVNEEDKDADIFSEQITAEKYHELRRKIFESIYDETKISLNLIVSYAEILKLKTSSTEANKVLSKIIEQTNFISHTLETHSGLYLDRKKLNRQVLYSSKILNEILFLLAGYTEFRGIKLLRKFEADASVLVDKNLFYQACLQVVKFLCEHTPPGGKLFVTLKRTIEDMLVEFKSSGEKISEEALKNIFNHLPHKKSTTLDLTKQIITELDGKIIVQNSFDAGPEIIFLLPVVK